MITKPNRVVAAVNRGVPHIENSHGRVPGRRRLFLAADESVTRPAELMELALTRYPIQSANAVFSASIFSQVASITMADNVNEFITAICWKEA